MNAQLRMKTVTIRRKTCYIVSFVFVIIVLLYWSNVESRGRVRKVKSFSSSEKLPINTKANELIAAVLVIACKRPEVKRCLESLLKYRPSEEKFHIVVSQGCGHEETSRTIAGYGKKLKFIKQPNLSQINQPGVPNHLEGYYKLSRHYKWALAQVFDVMQYETVIVLEDDLEVAVDFFEYFEALKPVLDTDPTLWCVSAWNDNGKEGYTKGNDLLYRSDFFPGLGWMLKKSVWTELKTKWPAAFWDDWMRHPDQRLDRACIRPEIPRTMTFGKTGVSGGQFFEKHLKFIKLNNQFYPFREKNLTYLVKSTYDKEFINTVYSSPLVSFEYLNSSRVMPARAMRLQYENEQTFVALAHHFGIMSDLKSGVPRMAYKGVVSFVFKTFRIYLAPPRNWNGYELQG